MTLVVCWACPLSVKDTNWLFTEICWVGFSVWLCLPHAFCWEEAWPEATYDDYVPLTVQRLSCVARHLIPMNIARGTSPAPWKPLTSMLVPLEGFPQQKPFWTQLAWPQPASCFVSLDASFKTQDREPSTTEMHCVTLSWPRKESLYLNLEYWVWFQYHQNLS